MSNNNGETALLLAAWNGHLPMVQWLLQKGGARIDEADNDGETALLLAAWNGHLPMVQWLLAEGGARIDDANNQGSTALLYAALNGHLPVVQWLLAEGGARIDETDIGGKTALLLAALNGQLPVVQWLLQEGGARIDETNNYGYTVWTYLEPHLKPKSVDQLRPVLQAMLACGVPPAVFTEAIPESLQHLLSQGAVVRERLLDGSQWRKDYAATLRASSCYKQFPPGLMDLVRDYAKVTAEEMWALVAKQESNKLPNK